MNRTSAVHVAVLLTFAALLVTGCAPCRSPRAPGVYGETFAVESEVTLNAFRTLLDRNLTAELNDLRLLASTEEAQSADWAKIRPLLARAEAMHSPGALWFGRPDGSYSVVGQGLTDKNLTRRQYFSRLLAGEDVVGVLVVSMSTGRRVAVLATPIMKNGTVVGVLGASVFLDDLADRIVADLQLKDDIILYALDPESGELALDRDTALILRKADELGSPSLAAAMETMKESISGLVHYSYNGVPREVIFTTSPLTGWRIALGRVTE